MHTGIHDFELNLRTRVGVLGIALVLALSLPFCLVGLHFSRPSPTNPILQLQFFPRASIAQIKTQFPPTPERLPKQALNSNRAQSHPALAHREEAHDKLSVPDITASDVVSADQKTNESSLKWDSKTLKDAYMDSRSEIQKMADKGDRQLISVSKNKYEKFQVAANEATLPDCFGKDSAQQTTVKLGAVNVGVRGLLATPLLLSNVLKRKCK